MRFGFSHRQLLIVFVAFIATGLLFAFGAKTVLAANGNSINVGLSQVSSTLGLGHADIRLTIANIIRVALGLLGIVVLGLMLYAGYLWMTAGGNEDQIAEAKSMMRNAVIGLAIIFSAYALVSFVFGQLFKATLNVPAHCANGVFDEGLEEQLDCGVECPACGKDPHNFGTPFVLRRVSAGGPKCVRNVGFQLEFNHPVDLSTVNASMSVVKTGATQAELGVWQYTKRPNGSDVTNVAVFVPAAQCGDSANTHGCYEANASYTVKFVSPSGISDTNGTHILSCALCNPVTFQSGSILDQTPPSVQIVWPGNGQMLPAGTVEPIKINYSDDAGMQGVSLYVDGQPINTSSTPSTCSQNGKPVTGQVIIPWDSQNNVGSHSLQATGYDQSGKSGANTIDVSLYPIQCFNHQVDQGEEDVDCSASASGVCPMCNGQAVIEDVSPANSAVGDYVTVSGRNFGENNGTVFFAKTASPPTYAKLIDFKNDTANWVEAPVVTCGAFDNWRPWQAVVSVPVGAVTGPIALVRANTAVTAADIDRSDDARGPKVPTNGNGAIVIGGVSHPSLCGINPTVGLPNALVQLTGKNLQGITNGAFVLPNNSIAVSVSNSSDASAQTRVPLRISRGTYGVKVTQNGNDSNAVSFVVSDPALSNLPFVANVSPTSGPKGQFITITGRRFGIQRGKVFLADFDDPATLHEVNFNDLPVACSASLIWSDTQIIAPVPDLGANGVNKKYFVRVQSLDSSTGGVLSVPNEFTGVFTFTNDNLGPNICAISPLSGPVPFPVDGKMTITGKRLVDTNPTSGNHPDVYFANKDTLAANNTISDRTPAIFSPTSFLQQHSSSTDVVTLLPPQSTPLVGTVSGPVVVVRNGQMSNPINFSVFDCTANNNQCATAGAHCCVNGAERGECKVPPAVCEGETHFAGYTWRFATKRVPVQPYVVEQCPSESAGNSSVHNFSPSPSVQWNTLQNNDHSNACLQAAITVLFSQPIDESSLVVSATNKVNTNNVKVFKCNGTTVTTNTCNISGSALNLSASVAPTDNNSASYLTLTTSSNWLPDTYYQVALSKDIVSAQLDSRVFGVSSTNILTSQKYGCTIGGTAYAYCFIFKTGNQSCLVKSIAIDPDHYLTDLLSDPDVMRNQQNRPVVYQASAITTEHCISMNANLLPWVWTTENNTYALPIPTSSPRTNVISKNNTVGVPGFATPDAVSIFASTTATTSLQGQVVAQSFTTASPLTIDLSNPRVVEYRPTDDCREVCPQALVYVKFSAKMADRNLGTNGDAIRLLKCNDENCVNTTLVTSSPTLAENDARKILIYNSFGVGGPLAPSTTYKVTVSVPTSSADLATRGLWSAGSENTIGKPFNGPFEWRFRTKNAFCTVNSVTVDPSVHYAAFMGERVVYGAQPRAVPDSCDANGQPLDPWSVGWNWASDNHSVAQVVPFVTKGRNRFCTDSCIRKGSDIPYSASTPLAPVCGNGIVEAGEDCDTPNPLYGCSLDCRFVGAVTNTYWKTNNLCGNGTIDTVSADTVVNGKTAHVTYRETCDYQGDQGVWCTPLCTNRGTPTTVASLSAATAVGQCGGTGQVSRGEDCDIAVPSNVTVAASSLLCSPQCLHLGSRLSSAWCYAHRTDFGGFTSDSFHSACASAYSQCGNGVPDPDEDPECDTATGVNPACDNRCLLKIGDSADDIADNKCQTSGVGLAGCNPLTAQHAGSSLLYGTPSVCGDGVTGLGEDAFCENTQNFTLVTNRTQQGATQGLANPWALVIGQLPTPTLVASQSATAQLAARISATTAQNTGDHQSKTGSGQYIMQCGYHSDAECQVYGPDFAVGVDSCCYLKPRLVSTYPNDGAQNVCRNTFISATFSKPINPASLQNNVIIARGVRTPQQIFTSTDLFSAQSGFPVALNDGHIFVGQGNTLNVLNVLDSTHPAIVAQFDAGFSIQGIAVAGDTVYVAENNKLDVLNFNKTDHTLSLVSTTVLPLADSARLANNTAYNTIALSGKYLYQAAGSAGLRIINVTDPTHPAISSTLPVSDYDNRVVVNGKRAYVIASRVCQANQNCSLIGTVDVTDPANPAQIATHTFGLLPRDLVVSGNHIFVATGVTIEVFGSVLDATAQPIPVAANVGTVSGFTVAGDYLFAVGGSGMQIFDVSADLNQPSFSAISGVSSKKDIKAMAFENDQWYLFYADGRFSIIDAFGKSVCSADHIIQLAGGLASEQNLPWYRKFYLRLSRWVERLWGEAATATTRNNITEWCDDGQTLGAANVYRVSSDIATSTVVVSLDRPLAPNADYAVVLTDGVRDTGGVSIGFATTGDGAVGNQYNNFKFWTRNDLCQINSVTVSPSAVNLYRAGATSTLLAQAASADGVVQSIPNSYAWNFFWGPLNPFIGFATTTATGENTITAQERNGELDLLASANVNDVTSLPGGNKGVKATGKSHIRVFLCDNPWPPRRVFPYEDRLGNDDAFDVAQFDNQLGFTGESLPGGGAHSDGYYNFGLSYCADSGVTGFVDDLPYLHPIVATDAVEIGDGTLKRFVFTNDKNNDVIGIQVFTNPKNLKIRDWYEQAKALGGREFSGNVSETHLGDYEALVSGSNNQIDNIYVDALNVTASTSGDVYSNVYLLSVNSDALPETRKVFELLKNNLQFNINLTNEHYCVDVNGNSVVNEANTITYCANDLECPTNSVCRAPIDKLKRNYIRLRDLQNIEQTLEGFYLRSSDFGKDSVAAWKLDQGQSSDNSTFTFSDVSGNYHTATCTDNCPVMQASNVFGKVMSFAGNDYLQIASSTAFHLNEMTVEAWIKPAQHVNLPILIRQGDFNFSVDTDASVIRFISPNKFGTKTAQSAVSLANQWHHIAVTVDANPSGRLMKFYLDGEPMNNVASVNSGDPQKNLDSNLPLQLGTTGLLANVAIYNRPLSASEIKRHYRFYPDLKAGTFLSGQAVSTWDTMWGPQLGKALSAPQLPIDPINKLGVMGTCRSNTAYLCVSDSDCSATRSTWYQQPWPAGAPAEQCVLHDPQTGWSTENRRLSFACPPDSYAYRYQFDDNNGYRVSARLEDVSATVAPQSWNNFRNTFIDHLERFTFDGICPQLPRPITTAQGQCGDGRVNVGVEECEPGMTEQGICSQQLIPGCRSIGGLGQCLELRSNIKTCNAQCHWVESSTSCATTCGNGIKDVNEICDDGRNNSNTISGRCKTDCSGRVANMCGNATKDQGELCDVNQTTPVTVCSGFPRVCHTENGSVSGSGVRYSLNKERSCGFDCRSYGPYCGDGVVQREFGEECDGNVQCSLSDGRTGTKYCSSECKYVNTHNSDPTLRGWWNFDFSKLGAFSEITPTIKDASDRHMDARLYLHNPSGASIEDGIGFGGSGGAKFNAIAGNYVDAGSLNELGQHFTVSFWAKQTRSPGFPQEMLGIGAEHWEDNGGFMMWQGAAADDKAYVEARLRKADIVPQADQDFSGTAYSADSGFNGSWIHYVAVWDAPNLSTYALAPTPITGSVAPHTKRGHDIGWGDYRLVIGGWARSEKDGFTINPFNGIIDNVSVWQRPFSPDEVKKLHNDFVENTLWFCSSTVPAAPVAPVPQCGDGYKSTDEACDEGAKNGVACTPTYGTQCSYCSLDCRNRIVVSPNLYCGNGKIDTIRTGLTEACEVVNGNVYSSSTANIDPAVGGTKVPSCSEIPNTSVNASVDENNCASPKWVGAACASIPALPHLKGNSASACTNNCQVLTTSWASCIACGVAGNGQQISGAVVDVSNPPAPLQNLSMRLYFTDSNFTALPLRRVVAADSVNGNTYALKDFSATKVPNGEILSSPAQVVNSPICSELTGEHYQMVFNADGNSAHAIPMIVTSSQKDYDFFLSPVIDKNTNPAKIRVVLSAKVNDIKGGVFVPDSNILAQEQDYAGRFPTNDAFGDIGIRYLKSKQLDSGRYVESYEFDFNRSERNINRATACPYSFFVRRDEGKSVLDYRGSDQDLKVEIYLPENDANPTHFARPVKTYYLKNVNNISDNKSVELGSTDIWRVFSIDCAGFAGQNSFSFKLDNIFNLGSGNGLVGTDVNVFQ